MRTVPTLLMALLLAVSGCDRKPDETGPIELPGGDEAAHVPAVEPAAQGDASPGKTPRAVKTVTCDCVCEMEACTCRPLRSGACVCFDEDFDDCPCTCGDSPVVSLETVAGEKGAENMSMVGGPPPPPDHDKRGPPPPPPEDIEDRPPPGEVHEGFELD